MNQNLSVLASYFMETGNLVACEIISRRMLTLDSKNPWALNMLGMIASRVGLPQEARAFFKLARNSDPQNRTIINNIRDLGNANKIRKVINNQKRFLLIKAWGQGFWSDFIHVAGCLLLAEITNRIPVTHWGENSLYKNDLSFDAFRNYFEPVSDFGIEDLAMIDGSSFFPKKWNKHNLKAENHEKFRAAGSSDAAALYLLNREETVVISDFYISVADIAPWLPSNHKMYKKNVDDIYRYVFDKFMRPRQEFINYADEFCDNFLKGSPFVSVHMRGSDKGVEDPMLSVLNDQILEEIKSINPSWPIFLMTDDENILASVKRLFGNRIITTNCQRTSSSSGLHYLDTTNKIEAGYEVLRDTLIALRADKFIGNGRSNVSAAISFLRDWGAGGCILVAETSLLVQNPGLHGIYGDEFFLK